MDSILTKITSVQIPVYLVVLICVLLVVFGFVCIKCKSMLESMTDVKPFESGECAESNVKDTGINSDSAPIKTVYVEGEQSADSFYTPTPFIAEGGVANSEM